MNGDGYIYHHGIKGQKWGVRRYKNKDGSLTPAEKAKERKKASKAKEKQKVKAAYKEINKQTSFPEKLVYNKETRRKAASYVVYNNMTVSKAREKARGDANKNTAVFMSAVAAISVSALMAKKIRG